MATHCETVSEQTSRPRPPRHDGLPRPSLALPSRNDNECVVNEMNDPPSRVLSSRGLKARGDPL